MKKRTFNKIERAIISVPRWVLRAGLLVLIIFMVLGALRYCQGDIDPPPIDQAPWVVQTYIYSDDGTRVPSRYYLGKEYSTIDGIPALKGYWDFDGKEYRYHEAVKMFRLEDYGPVDIIRRR